MDNTSNQSAPVTAESPWKGSAPGSSRNRLIALIIAIIVILGLLYLGKGLLVAGTVNGSPIWRLSVIHLLEKQSGSQALNALVSQKLLEQEANRKGIVVTPQEINDQVATVTAQLKAQNVTLDSALSQQGMTLNDFKQQIAIQKEVEKLLADKISVTNAEIDQYIKDNKITIPAGQEANYRSQIKDQLAQQKLSAQAQGLLSTLQAAAKINYFVKY